MDLTSHSQSSITTLLVFLGSHSSQQFTQKDFQWLFQIPKVADVLNRVVQASLHSDECVLGVDELDVYESLEKGEWERGGLARNEEEIRRDVGVLDTQSKVLRRQIESMKRRLTTLNNINGSKSTGAGGDVDQMNLKMEEAHEQLYNEKWAISQDIRGLITSLAETPSQQWTFTHSKHINDIYSSDDELLHTLDNISNIILAANEDESLSAEMDALSSQLADVQFRLFTAQISHTYLTSLSQPPTPSRNQSNSHTNSMSELKTLQTELDALVTHCEEATQLLARQSVMDKVSDTLVRGSIQRMEKELDGVERVEDTLEGMIGRMTIARDLLRHETSKIDALGQVLTRLGEKQAPIVQKDMKSRNHQAVVTDPEIAEEMMALQRLIGIKSPEDVQKIVSKGDRLDKELFESDLRSVNTTLEETKGIVEALTEAIYADSATKDIKFVDPEVISQVQTLEHRIDNIKREMSTVSNVTGSGAQSARFVEKWV